MQAGWEDCSDPEMVVEAILCPTFFHGTETLIHYYSLLGEA